jgi:hypothetical protein
MLLNKAETTLFAYPSASGDIVLPESIITIGDGAFRGCPALKTVSLPAATAIGDYAFQNCAALETANLPKATAIGENAFLDDAALKTANLPAATAIGTKAFRNCAALESLTLGTTIPTLVATVFYNAGNGEGFTIYVPDGAAKAALEEEIATTSSDWYKALKDTSMNGIYRGKFKEVKVTQ